jgi:hypothetical protein
MGEDKSKWIVSNVSEDFHTKLVEYSNYWGWKLGDTLVRLAEEALSKVKDDEEIPGLKIWKGVYEYRKREQNISLLRELLYAYVETQDEELYDQCVDYATILNLDVTELLSTITSSSALINVIRGGKKPNDVDRWLSGFFKSEDDLVPVQSIFDAGDEIGISEHRLKYSKKRLGLVSVKEGKIWCWMYPEELTVPI